MTPLFRGVELGRIPGPTLKAARTMRNLCAALHEISRRPVGVDEIPYEAFLDPIGHMRWNPNLLDAYPDLNPLKAIQESLAECFIPDASQALRVENRNLERGTVANRIVERAITRKLTSNLDRYLNDRSFGYRTGRSPETAILEVRKAVRSGAHWALKTDFRDFFESVDRGILENMLRQTIADQALCDAVMAVTSPALVIHGRTMQRQNALPQGNGLSPWLSNLYMNAFDEACSHLEYFRYADDMLVLGRSWKEVTEALRHIRGLARSLGLRLNQKKTFIRDLRRKPVIFLGYELRGGNVYPPEEAIRRLRHNLELRGIGDRKALLTSFVARFHFGRVRKLFRRLDRQLRHLYPPTMSLVSLLEAIRQRERDIRRRKQQQIDLRQLRRSHGQGCGTPDEKAVPGSPPRPAQPGAVIPDGTAAPPLRKYPALLEETPMRSPEYLNFIRTRPCSFCGNPLTEPHHCIKRLRGISQAQLAQKGSDYLAIPVCHRCHEDIRDGRLQPRREEYLELCLINLICYLDASQKRENPAKVDAAVPLGG
jgi:hypothetical protein